MNEGCGALSFAQAQFTHCQLMDVFEWKKPLRHHKQHIYSLHVNRNTYKKSSSQSQLYVFSDKFVSVEPDVSRLE